MGTALTSVKRYAGAPRGCGGGGGGCPRAGDHFCYALLYTVALQVEQESDVGGLSDSYFTEFDEESIAEWDTKDLIRNITNS